MTRVLQGCGLFLALMCALARAESTHRIDTATAREGDNHESLQGTWELAYLANNGDKRLDDGKSRVIIRDNRFIVEEEGKQTHCYNLKFGTTSEARTLDIYPMREDENGKELDFIAAIYKIEGGTATICWGENRKIRLRKFPTPNDKGSVLVLRLPRR